MSAVLIACLSALLFGAMSVGLRIALQRRPDVPTATIATLLVAFAVALVWAAADAPFRWVHLRHAWPFALAGMLSPGLAQIFVTLAVRDVGASRSSVVLGSAPLVAVTIALIFLGEPVSVPLLVGAVLIVAGGVELARERDRPEHLLSVGLLFAFIAVVLFSIRDNVLRWLAVGSSVPPPVAAAAALAGGAAVSLAVLGPRLGGRRLRDGLRYVPVGIFFGTSYVLLFEAYYRGRVSVVSPLIATESLWGVVLAVLLLRESEVVGRRLVLGAALIVAGGALIGAYR